MSEQRTVFLSVPGGFVARYLLKSDILPTLRAAGARVVALVPEEEGAAMLEGLDHHLDHEPLRNPPRAPSAEGPDWRRAARTQLWRLRRFALDCRDNGRAREKYDEYRALTAPHSRRAAELAIHVFITRGLWRSRLLRRLVLWAETQLTHYDLHADLFDRYRPDLVVAPGLGYYSYDEALLREARDRGIPTAVLIHAWDNPSTKGYRGATADLVVAWSENMRDQLVRYQDVPASRIEIGGVPQWDGYLRPGVLPDRAATFDHFGLHGDCRLLVYATPAPNRSGRGGYHSGMEMARWLAQRVDDGAFGPDVQLLVRLHPGYGKRGFPEESEFATLDARYPSTHVNRPTLAAEGILDSMTDQDRSMLGGLLKHCDILINFWSTTTLEACLLDTPVVVAHFNPPGADQPALSDWHQFAHLRALIESDAARVARTGEELVEAVHAYLADPALDRSRRARIALQECGPLDGYAGRRVGHILLSALGLERADWDDSGARTTAQAMTAVEEAR
ncbi:MAG: hypothetical protein WKF96_17415 [Solirubrobacteraceae bacterium]